MTDDDFDFRDLSTGRLGRLSDEQLLDCMRRARTTGHDRAQQHVLEQLIGRYAQAVLSWNLKVPENRREDLAQDILMGATRALLEGKRIDNFRAWLSQVAKNHVAEFHRGREGRQLRADRQAAGLTDHLEDDSPSSVPELTVEGGYGGLEMTLLIDDIRARLSDSHRRVIDLYVFDAFSAREVSDATGESEANVFKVAQRFRDELRTQLDEMERGDIGGPA